MRHKYVRTLNKYTNGCQNLVKHEERFRGKWMSEFDKMEIGKIGISENKNNNAHYLYFI